jgi:DNA-binding NtrC family response regulator
VSGCRDLRGDRGCLMEIRVNLFQGDVSMSESCVLFTDDQGFAGELQGLLGRDRQVCVSHSLSEVTEVLSSSGARCLIVDFRDVVDGGHDADRFLEELESVYPELHVILVSGADCPEPLERRATCGGHDLLRSEDPARQVAGCVEYRFPLNPEPVSNETNEVISEGHDSAEAVFEGVTRRFETSSPMLREMLEDLAIAAAHDVTILLIGETGCGKTYLSKLIHEASPRRDEPFIHVACGALPRDLIESELFGHAKGAFTSAHADKEGKFIAAGRGTILLDEIDVLAPEQQVKLLRVMETGEFEPVGSNRTLKSQARLVVASNLELQPLVEQGRFRPDLYYRLNMLKFDIPPLRSRKVDIVPLAKKFIRKFAETHGIAVEEVQPEFLDSLLAYPWPGNVRELEHVIQRAVIYCREGVLARHQLPRHILAGAAGPANDPSVKLTNGGGWEADTSLEARVAVSERDIIEQALSRNNFSRTNTAKDLGISRVTLYNKMKRYELMH